MIKKSKVYTKGGDKGETSLVSGTRCKKSDFRVDLYGEVDELNSYIGLVHSHLNNQNDYFREDTRLILLIQSSLFDLGSKLACEFEFWEKYKLPDIKESLVLNIEKRIDELDTELPTLKNFVLPGGAVSAANAHIVRTVCRRVERKLIAYREMNSELPINSVVLLNRLSDYFFILARSLNFKNKVDEPKWIP
jgi:cob(I)alamin adenosyltransferase